MTAHTPGPWTYTGEHDNDFVVWGPGEDEHVANIGNSRFAPVGDLVAFDVLDQANARLIAAAPDLLEACRQAAITFRFYEQSHLAKKTDDGDAKAHRNHEMAAICEAAIARAALGSDAV